MAVFEGYATVDSYKVDLSGFSVGDIVVFNGSFISGAIGLPEGWKLIDELFLPSGWQHVCGVHVLTADDIDVLDFDNAIVLICSVYSGCTIDDVDSNRNEGFFNEHLLGSLTTNNAMVAATFSLINNVITADPVEPWVLRANHFYGSGANAWADSFDTDNNWPGGLCEPTVSWKFGHQAMDSLGMVVSLKDDIQPPEPRIWWRNA